MNLKITSREGILYNLEDIVRFEIKDHSVIAIMPYAEDITIYENRHFSNLKSVLESLQNILDFDS